MSDDENPYPPPLVINPSSGIHTHTIISLHGRGDTAKNYGMGLLLSTGLQERLPTLKFVFPGASRRALIAFKGSYMQQWFDIYSLADLDKRANVQVEGLLETAGVIRDIINREAEILGEENRRNIILWGLSQGCAAGIFTLLGGQKEIGGGNLVGAFVGLSGWLPFHKQLSEIISSSKNDNSLSATRNDKKKDSEAEASAHSDSQSDKGLSQQETLPKYDHLFENKLQRAPTAIDAINHVRGSLGLAFIPKNQEHSKESSDLAHLGVPLFIGHGAQDRKIAVDLGKRMADLLSNGLGMNVTWKEYEGLAHWYRVEDEIEDILNFLKDRVALTVSPAKEPSKGEEQGT